MAETGDINVTIYRADRVLWDGASVHLELMDPFSDIKKILVDHDTKPGVSSVLMKGAPTEKGQNYILFAYPTGTTTTNQCKLDDS
jgi:hypothetical protein